MLRAADENTDELLNIFLVHIALTCCYMDPYNCKIGMSSLSIGCFHTDDKMLMLMRCFNADDDPTHLFSPDEFFYIYSFYQFNKVLNPVAIQ